MGKLETVITGRNSHCIYTSMAYHRSSEEKHIKQLKFMQILSLKNGWNSSISIVAYMEKAGFPSQGYLLKRNTFFVVKKPRNYMTMLLRVQFSYLFACSPEIETDVWACEVFSHFCRGRWGLIKWSWKAESFQSFVSWLPQDQCSGRRAYAGDELDLVDVFPIRLPRFLEVFTKSTVDFLP